MTRCFLPQVWKDQNSRKKYKEKETDELVVQKLENQTTKSNLIACRGRFELKIRLGKLLA